MNMTFFNERTQQFETGYPDNPEDLLPQTTAALGMYRCYIALGLDPNKAAINVLSRCLGEEAPYEVDQSPTQEPQ